jgi:hypothetical protein
MSERDAEYFIGLRAWQLPYAMRWESIETGSDRFEITEPLDRARRSSGCHCGDPDQGCQPTFCLFSDDFSRVRQSDRSTPRS